MLRILTIIILLMFPALPSYAQIITVETEGTYLVGDGPDENINLAKELARREALRNASEKAGVYVQSYSVTKNNILSNDEITIISSNILQITKQECAPVVENNHIKFVYKIKANVDTSNLQIQIDRILSKKDVLNKNIALEKRISLLENENSALKLKYKNTTDESQKELYQKLILQNEANMINTFRYTERLPRCEMAIGDITFGTTLETVKKIYGMPSKVERYSLDGVIAIHYFYGDNFRVIGRVFARWDKEKRKYYSDLKENEYPVTGFEIKDGRLSMPCGIKVGDSYLKVVEKFGIGAKYQPYGENDKIGFSYLLRATLEEMNFEVDKNGIIRRISTATEV